MVTGNPGTVALTAKGRRTRARIIQIAAELMLANGVARTTIEDVCDAGGVGRSQIYHYFCDKSELVRGVIEHQTDRVLAHQEPFNSDLTNWRNWYAWRDRIVETQRRLGCVAGCPIGSLANELADSDDLARRVLNQSFDRWQRAFSNGIQQMKSRHLLNGRADPTALSTFILGALQGGLLLCQTRKDVDPLEISLNAALAYLHTYDDSGSEATGSGPYEAGSSSSSLTTSDLM